MKVKYSRFDWGLTIKLGSVPYYSVPYYSECSTEFQDYAWNLAAINEIKTLRFTDLFCVRLIISL